MNNNATNVKPVKTPQVASGKLPAATVTMPVANKTTTAVGCGCDSHPGTKHQKHGQKLGKC